MKASRYHESVHTNATSAPPIPSRPKGEALAPPPYWIATSKIPNVIDAIAKNSIDDTTRFLQIHLHYDYSIKQMLVIASVTHSLRERCS